MLLKNTIKREITLFLPTNLVFTNIIQFPRFVNTNYNFLISLRFTFYLFTTLPN